MKARSSEKEDCGQTFGAPDTSEISTPALCSGPWTIESVCDHGEPRRLTLSTGERAVLGSREDCDLRIRDPSVSGHHCQLDASSGHLVVTDLGSRNGVFASGIRIDRARIGDAPTTLVVGRSRITVRCAAAAPSDCEVESGDDFEGTSEPMLRLKREVRRVASLRAPVLILGESGAGKDVVARALHRWSDRAGPYVPLNVATIPESLADSELFGHRKGAFTGALQSRVGAFELAHQGTLFLDEIGDLAPQVQAKLLRILEDGRVRPVGATEERRIDVRVVSATWTSLFERSAAGKFRFDLLQRLSVVVLEVPPLRERRSDIPLLARYWLKRYRPEVGVRELTQRAMDRLCSYDWPGNVRELAGAVYRACVLSDGDPIDVAAIDRAMIARGVRYGRTKTDPRELLLRAGGNVSEAARLAGLPRTTFRTWLSRSQDADSKTGK